MQIPARATIGIAIGIDRVGCGNDNKIGIAVGRIHRIGMEIGTIDLNFHIWKFPISMEI